ncbi:hypothetical protein CPB86DRAFT_740557 [Serendipita vermifera]|nr:hypothetical protein CPB86DRAFT_740557 [Serendipita vermifera]
MTSQEAKVLNIFTPPPGSVKDNVFDLASPFNLDRIRAEYVTLGRETSKQIRIPPNKNHLCYIITGNGHLESDNRHLELAKDSCFSFAASNQERTYILVSSTDQDAMGVLVLEDIEAKSYTKKKEHKDEPPTVISSVDFSKWWGKGIDITKRAHCSAITDMGLELERVPWGVNIECIPPGTQSSNAHCHELEDEFVIILSGKARYWHQGITPEPILKAGDYVGWKAGTGICHTLLNDAEDENGSGEDLVFLVWGEDKPGLDRVHYATAHPEWWTPDYRWNERPEHPQGVAPALPRFPRPDDKPAE